MKLTREEALKLHRQMWSDMQKKLGDCPAYEQRNCFKETWCINHTPEAMPDNDCYLCEYVKHTDTGDCDNCPIDWGNCCMDGKVDFRYSPISEILALPESKE